MRFVSITNIRFKRDKQQQQQCKGQMKEQMVLVSLFHRLHEINTCMYIYLCINKMT